MTMISGSGGNLGVAIKHPLLQNRWLLTDVTGLEPDEIEDLNLQVLFAHFEFDGDSFFEEEFYGFVVAKHKLLMVFEEPVSGIEQIIEKLSKFKSFDITIDNLNFENERAKRSVYRGCRVKKYTNTLDYSRSETCKYKVEFSVTGVSYPHK